MPSNTYQKKVNRERKSTAQEAPLNLNLDEASQPITSESKDFETDQQEICYHGRRMTHATHAWRKAAVMRCFKNNLYDLDRIQERTGIPQDALLQIFIELQPDQKDKE